MKKPVKEGCDFIRGDGWKPKLFTKLGAQRLANKLAKSSPLRNAVGFVSDMGEYWRINIGAKI